MSSVAKWSEEPAGTGLGGKALEGLRKFMDERRHSECPLEWRAGMVEGFFTPLAVRMGLWAMTHLSPSESEGVVACPYEGAVDPAKSAWVAQLEPRLR